MLQSLYFAALLLTAVCTQNVLDPGANNVLDNVTDVVAVPDSTNTLPPPLSPPSPPLPSPTTPSPPFPPSANIDLKTSSKGAQPPGLVVTSQSIGASGGSTTSCSFSVGAADNFHPQTDSFGYPQSIIQQAFEGTVAEKALLALQEAKLRAAYTATGNSNNNINIDINYNGQLGAKNPIPRGINSQNRPSFNGDTSPFRPLPPANSPNSLNDLNDIIGSNPLAYGGPSNQFSNNAGGNGLLDVVDATNTNSNDDQVFSLNPSRDQGGQPFNYNLDQLFPGGSGNNRFPKESFFSPQRFTSSRPSSANRSPFGFYGFQNTDPLDAIKSGSGNDPYGGQPRQFEGLNPFQIDNQFPALRRVKRQSKRAGSQVTTVCDSQPRLLRKYRHYGGVCYVIHPDLQHVTYVTCSNSPCSKCQYPGGATRCLPDTRGVALWAYCESGPFSQDVGLDFIHLPVVCSCKTMACT